MNWLDILRYPMTIWNIIIGVMWLIFTFKGKRKAASNVFAYSFPVCFWELYKWWRDGRDINIPAKFRYHITFEYDSHWVLRHPQYGPMLHLQPLVKFRGSFTISGTDDFGYECGALAILSLTPDNLSAFRRSAPSIMCIIHPDGVLEDIFIGDVDPGAKEFARGIAQAKFRESMLSNYHSALYDLEDFYVRIAYAHWVPDSPVMMARYNTPEGENIEFSYTRFRKKLRVKRVMGDE